MPDTIFYTVRKTARILGITPGDVSDLCNTGVLASCHQGVLRSVSAASVNTYAADVLKAAGGILRTTS